MRMTISDLGRFIDVTGIEVADLVEKLNLAGVEVEKVYDTKRISGLVVARVASCQLIEGTHLHLLSIEAPGGPRQVICGAPNVAAGQNVVLALPGAQIGDITIKEARIRGYDSCGMCCSFKELGVDPALYSTHEGQGIIVLAEEAKVGDDPYGWLMLTEPVLEISPTPNRGDCLSLVGLAYEVAALYGRAVKVPCFDLARSKKKTNDIVVETSGCFSFHLNRINNIRVTRSPYWLRRWLVVHGLRDVDNIVDIANYVMLITGQPLHTYSGDQVGEAAFVVTDQYQGPFTTLFGDSVEVVKGDLLIRPGQVEGCLAGVVGAAQSAIGESTSSIVVEAAVFDPRSIRRTSKRLDLVSDSSTRFVRGVDPARTLLALNMFMEELAIQDRNVEFCARSSYLSKSVKPTLIELTTAEVNRLLGTSFVDADVADVLRRLGLDYQVSGSTFVVVPTSRRQDIAIKEDLIEEIIRIKGFAALPATLPGFLPPRLGLTPWQVRRESLKRQAVDIGFVETISYSLSDGREEATLVGSAPLRLVNPFVQERSCLRRSLLPSLLAIAEYNHNRQASGLRLFEVSNLYGLSDSVEALGLLAFGDVGTSFAPDVVDLPYLQSVLSSLLSPFGVVSFVASSHPLLHRGRCAQVNLNGKKIGVIGQLSLAEADRRGLDGCLVCEVALDSSWSSSPLRYSSPSPYPFVTRDLALLVPEGRTCDEVLGCFLGEYLVSKEIFDVYQGQGIEPGYKSVAVRLTLASPTSTFTDAAIKAIIDELLGRLAKTGWIKIRD